MELSFTIFTNQMSRHILESKSTSPYNLEFPKFVYLVITKAGYKIPSHYVSILCLLRDLDARPHEITLLKIKHIRLKAKKRRS